ncbi:tRNA (adenosine(37)-N6)-threonylcarbamoyltransferase complex transferase subunit TsaD [Candidatus Phytoplasma melaleucae]|uniref:tRNA N6-adenosine threonylcarbamoyltransferase n=1 Tax=Candidatus Phytoplasma melaleucae TaxID=2982630 RepID=A0ABT9DFG8_9MOLU|nr:tRNA (adenosine(37)-N6)-threonylcarbamoyltransferase complex transferase subunit TsaD ['Melaleuca sp.' phytoplasma]MDO8168206.1 tRNA (adenosine(37)-N6)-threonylcarbamoyltransferase complex transferase subunit TsaD ['Melaleuca sp.' phytoplasma]MDV3205282.1 tRNA (adenosine(37)-N6)-threonylcarbamoyltransferase complex transferase subunit TsaD [Weeping tea tree witches'-broom phytoplasma]
MLILSIETSCDETSVAITQNGKRVLSNIIFSQIEYHKKYGGVVPEIASRQHLTFITLILHKALKKAKILPKNIDLVAVTQGPGLIGSLLLGINAANTFAYIHQKPLIGVNHLMGHIYAAQIEYSICFPSLALIVSGGHTELIYIKNHFNIQCLGYTLDDALGEVYDKIAKNLNLGYPGGPIIEKLALKGKDIFHYSRPYLKNNNLNFSFSGIKSEIIHFIKKNKAKITSQYINDICASFQASVIDVLITKTKRAINRYPVRQLIITGGVAANHFLRNRFKNIFHNLEVVIPNSLYCTDQAAMIGIAAYYQKKFCSNQKINHYNLTGHSDLSLI